MGWHVAPSRGGCETDSKANSCAACAIADISMMARIVNNLPKPTPTALPRIEVAETLTKSLPDVMDQSEMERLIASPDEGDPYFARDVAMIELLYAGGLRASELSNMDRGQLHLDLHVVRVIGKGNKERIVPVGLPAVKAIE